MARQNKGSTRDVEIIKQIIKLHQKLFDGVFHDDAPEMITILHQMIQGKPQHKSIKVYQYLLESFLFAGGGGQSNLAYYAKQRVRPTFSRVQRAVKAAQYPNLATFETFKGWSYRKTPNKCIEPALLDTCPVRKFDMKRGSLNHMAFSVYFFLRNVAGGAFTLMSGSTLGRASRPRESSTTSSTALSAKSRPLPTSALSSPTWLYPACS
jgi:hypothetical protein